jgi:hypothetical protein
MPAMSSAHDHHQDQPPPGARINPATLAAERSATLLERVMAHHPKLRREEAEAAIREAGG